MVSPSCVSKLTDSRTEHSNLLCEAYATLPPRPTVKDRLHIFFPAGEARLRFIWLKPNKTSLRAAIDPNREAIGIESSWISDRKLGYSFILHHTAAFLTSRYLQPSQSLGTATALPPLRSMKGNALLSVLGLPNIVEDVSPTGLPELLAYLKGTELDHQRSHDPRSGYPQSATPY